MSYRLQKDEPLPEGVKRIALEQIDDAQAYLQSPGDDLDVAVHETRKCFKKVRGLLRLVRKENGETVYQRENICFRDSGRLLSDLRDRKVMINTLDYLAVLQALVGRRPSPRDDDAARTIFNSLVKRERTELQARAIRQGQRIYPESPEVFVDRIKAYWEESRI